VGGVTGRDDVGGVPGLRAGIDLGRARTEGRGLEEIDGDPR
jgi:hypothetical protein